VSFDWGRPRGEILGLYILVGQTPVPEPDPLKWAEWFETAERQVARDEIGAGLVSTVFLGLDHDHMRNGPPILFETMVFADGGEIEYMERCSTWLEAEAMHKRAVAEWKKRQP
jgi:hypothetical protein